jgi:hypothetical protein
MTTIVYEELEAYFEQLKNMNTGKPIYMTLVRTKKEQTLGGVVRVMFKDDTGVFHCYNHAEDIPEIMLLSSQVFDLLPNEEQAKAARAEYMATLDAFEKALIGEYEKMKAVLLKEFNVASIINAYLV